MLGKGAPELRKVFNLPIILQAQFEFIGRMDIDNNRQPLPENHVQRGIEITQVGRIQSRRVARVHQWRWLYRKTDMIEANRFDERDVFCRSMGFEMFFCVVVVCSLREPMAEINAVPETGEPPAYHVRGCLRSARARRRARYCD